MNLTYNVTPGNGHMTQQPPTGDEIARSALVGPANDPAISLVLTRLGPGRRGGGARFCLWLTNARGLSNGTIATRSTENEARALALHVAADLRAQVAAAATPTTHHDTQGAPE